MCGAFLFPMEPWQLLLEEMEAMFRTELKDINTKTEQRIAAVNRLSSSDPRLRKSALMDLEVAKGEWVQTARDKNMVRQAEMRLKSEFFGAEGLFELAKVAIDEETGFNKLNFIANELNLNKDQLNINADLAVAAIIQRAEGMGLEKDRLTMEADRMLAEIGQRGESLEMQVQGLSLSAGQMAMQQGRKQQDLWFNQKTFQQQQIAQQSGLFNQAQDMFRWGRNYQLSAAGAASGLAGAGMTTAANVYGTQANPAWFDAPQEFIPNPIWGLMGAALGAGGAAAGGMIASDSRLKKNIVKVGSFDNGLSIYRFQFKGSNVTQIGAIAQEVEKVIPEAVVEIDGIKLVNYEKATANY